jgi:hypothetical protein
MENKTISDILKSVQTTAIPTGVNNIQSRALDCKERAKAFLVKMQIGFNALVAGTAKLLSELVPIALHFVQALKTVVDNPAMDIIDALIPSKLPAEIVAQLRAHLGTVIDLLQLQLTCGKEATLEDKIACYLQYLRTCSPDMKDAIYHKTASLLTQLMAGKHQFTNSEVDTMVQLGYVQLKHVG